MFEKVALLSVALIMAGTPWKANSDQTPSLAMAGDNSARECRLALKTPPKNWVQRLRAGRCGAWRDVRSWTEQHLAAR